MRVQVLGELTVDGRPVVGERQVRLARALLSARGRAVPGTHLVAELWDGDEPADPRGALQAQVSRLRRTGLAIEAVGGGYRIRLDGVAVDALEARALLEAATASHHAGELDQARAAATAGLALWPAPETAQEPELWIALLVALTQVELAAGRVPSRLEALLRASDEHPTDEPLAAIALRALAASGRQSQALERYESLRTLLAERFGTDPSSVVADVHLALVRGELDASAGASDAHRAPRPARVIDGDVSWRRDGTPLLGREQDVARVERALDAGRLVTLVAVGGAGKTRLALEVAARAADRGEPVHVLELAHIRRPDQVLPALLALAGTTESTPAEGVLARRVLDADRRLATAAQALDGVLVVDNCEHLLDAAADVVAGLLRYSTTLRVLTTSRAPLGLPAEIVHDVSALPDPVALTLLHDRASATRAGLTWDDEIAAELCRRLDNLPLALELAAARTRSMPLGQILAGVEDRFALLDHAVRGLPDRHQGLWAMVDWSWALLSPSQQDLLVELAVIPEPFGPELAAAVHAVSVDRVRLDLAALVEQSLVQLEERDGVAVHRLLETVREYGEARLVERGDRDLVMGRLAAWAAALARELVPTLVGPRQVETFATIGRNQDTLIAGMAWAIEHEAEHESYPVGAMLLSVWTSRGMHAEAARWAAALVGSGDPARRCRSFALHGDQAAVSPHERPAAEEIAGVAMHGLLNGAASSDRRAAAVSLRMLRRVAADERAALSGRTAALVDVLLGLGEIGRDPEVWAVSAGAQLSAQPDAQLAGLGLFLQAALAENVGDGEQAGNDAREAYGRFRAAGDHWGMGVAAQLVARDLATAGEHAGSQEWLARAEDHLRLIGAAEDMASVQVLRAVTGLAEGEPGTQDVLVAMANDASQTSSRRGQAALGLAAGLVARGRRDEAVEWADRAVATSHDLGAAPQFRVMVLVVAALVRLRSGRPAASLLEAAVPDALVGRDGPMLGILALGFAQLAASQGGRERADELQALAGRLGGSLAWFVGQRAADVLLGRSTADGRRSRSELTSQAAVARVIALIAPDAAATGTGWSPL